jgi:hypothetical protein
MRAGLERIEKTGVIEISEVTAVDINHFANSTYKVGRNFILLQPNSNFFSLCKFFQGQHGLKKLKREKPLHHFFIASLLSTIFTILNRGQKAALSRN